MPTRSTPPGEPRRPSPLDAARAVSQRPASEIAFPVVGVGASGGVDAFRQLLAHVPADSGLALVLVQPLDARASPLGDALTRATAMKVAQAEEGARVEPNRVYVSPPGARMAIEQGVLKLSPLDEDGRRPHLPIDFFLRSLAAERGRQAIGVVLSGTASDGTAGLAAIRAHGGITFAQAPRPAPAGGMPRGAADAGVADLCLPLQALGAELARLARHPYLAPIEPVPTAPAGADLLAQVVALLRAAAGVDFGEYKPATFKRRLARRMAIRKALDLAAYVEVLRRDPAEVRSLHDDLLIKVTSFFRDEGSFDDLKALAFPEILRHKPPGAPIRAWVVGCATGEEVYSLAISLVEHLGGGPPAHPILIFGSDLGEKAIEDARAGLYPDAAVHGLGKERLERFFVRAGQGWRVSRALRELCVFVRHDVARDPPFSRLDLLSCRNVLIYFGQALQQRVLATAHYCLNQPGYLLLGGSESVSGVSKGFARASRGGRLFLRKPGPSTYRFAPRAAASPFAPPPSAPDDPVPPTTGGAPAGHLEERGPGSDAPAPGTEELQSLNEELETAKEELQATNEALSTMNDELRGRNRDLQLVNADVLNLLDAVEIPILMLDEERRIRRFTRRAEAFMGLTAGDVGRRIADVALPIQAPDLERWITQAMDQASLVEAEVQDRFDRWHRLQIRPRRSPGGRTDGTLLSLVDIHDLKHEVASAELARDDAERRQGERRRAELPALAGEARQRVERADRRR